MMNFSRPSLGLGFIGLNLSAYILDNNLVGNTYICKNEYDMRVQSILLSLTMVLAFISCGTQKATVSSTDEGPIIQTKFLGGSSLVTLLSVSIIASPTIGLSNPTTAPIP